MKYTIFEIRLQLWETLIPTFVNENEINKSSDYDEHYQKVYLRLICYVRTCFSIVHSKFIR